MYPHIPEEGVPQADRPMVRPDHDMTRLTQGPTGYTPELTGISANDGFTELSPTSERLMMNQPIQTLNPSAGPGSFLQPDGSLMQPSSNGLRQRNGEKEASTNKKGSHVMSWMEYDGQGGGGMGPKL